MIEPDPEMFLFSELTDDQLREIEEKYGPAVKDSYLQVMPCSLSG